MEHILPTGTLATAVAAKWGSYASLRDAFLNALVNWDFAQRNFR